MNTDELRAAVGDAERLLKAIGPQDGYFEPIARALLHLHERVGILEEWIVRYSDALNIERKEASECLSVLNKLADELIDDAVTVATREEARRLLAGEVHDA